MPWPPSTLVHTMLLPQLVEPGARQPSRTAPTHAPQERFAPGSLFDVRDITTERGKRRVIHFYSRARLDGLVRREEITGVKISEVFTGREDRLEYRSATFGGGAAATAAAAGGGDAPAAGGAAAGAGDAGGGAGGGERSLAMAKMAEKFARDPSKSADEDVAKRVFYVAQGRVELRHHLGEGRVTAGYVVMQRDGPAQAVQVGDAAGLRHAAPCSFEPAAA